MERLGTARPERRAVHRGEEPFVRVHDDRVGVLGPVEAPAKLRAHGRRACVGGVDVQPDTRLPAAHTELSHRVDRGRRGAADRCDDGGCVVEWKAGIIRNSASTGTVRYSSPRIRAAFSTEKCACSEPYTTPPGRIVRAAARAASVEVDAVSSMCP